MHGGPSPGAPKGNRNAFKHGRFPVSTSGQAIALSFFRFVRRSNSRAPVTADGTFDKTSSVGAQKPIMLPASGAGL
jgi:hypothetical protein